MTEMTPDAVSGSPDRRRLASTCSARPRSCGVSSRARRRGVRQVRPVPAGRAARSELADRTPREPGRALRLVYTGKFAPRWNTYEMTQLPGLLAARGVAAELHMVGDKIHNDPDDPGYHRRMRAALGDPPADAARGPARPAMPPRRPSPPAGWCGAAAIPGKVPCASRPLRHRAELAAPQPGRQPGAVDQGPGVRHAGAAGHPEPDPDARSAAGRGLPDVRAGPARRRVHRRDRGRRPGDREAGGQPHVRRRRGIHPGQGGRPDSAATSATRSPASRSHRAPRSSRSRWPGTT